MADRNEMRKVGAVIRVKPAILMLAVLILFSLPGSAFGQANKFTETTTSTYDYFRLGEICHSLQRYEYFNSIGGVLKQRLDDHRKFMQKMNVSQATLSAFDALASIAMTMPFPNNESFNKWSADKQEKWKNDGRTARDNLLDAMKADMKKNPQSEFFYWMGYQSLKLAWSVPMDLNDYGYKVSELKSTVKGALDDFVWLRDEKLAQGLAPEVAATVKTIAGMRTKVDDPLEGMSAGDINKLAERAQSIRDAVKEKKLVR